MVWVVGTVDNEPRYLPSGLLGRILGDDGGGAG
jgi:hypothetical protein